VERLVKETDSDFARWRRAKILGAAPPREFETTHDPGVAPLATFVAHLRCATVVAVLRNRR
jgi:hypothetical protein